MYTLRVSQFAESNIGINGSQHVKDQDTVQKNQSILTNKRVI